ncbi:glutamate--tRNA ligase, partial [candidate division KSB1 bacterium]|nr:glutamate--tRNA ligase [candidate division KSB1 bacterium]NIT72823.1 glutamate--tRNA ligase [candidate division KSB1 bacterium]NIW70998.1 glutamate--tRNA ligase [candidate division KSB1 bacterium]NIX72503.1 glutamate--tRNA ligase [candidate division KSB1 bacterium]
IQEALGAPRPAYAHIPLILAQDKSKLSKRHGAVSVLEYRDMGYLSDAVVNFLALMGWNPGTDEELFDREELIRAFSLEQI